MGIQDCRNLKMTSNPNHHLVLNEFSSDEIKLIASNSFRFSLDELFNSKSDEPVDLVNAIRHYRNFCSTVQPFKEIISYLKTRVEPGMSIELPLDETDIPPSGFVYGTCQAACFLCERFKICLTQREAFSSRAIISKFRVLTKWTRYHAHCIKWTHEVALRSICELLDSESDCDDDESEEEEERERSVSPRLSEVEMPPEEDEHSSEQSPPYINPAKAGPSYDPESPVHVPVFDEPM